MYICSQTVYLVNVNEYMWIYPEMYLFWFISSKGKFCMHWIMLAFDLIAQSVNVSWMLSSTIEAILR